MDISMWEISCQRDVSISTQMSFQPKIWQNWCITKLLIGIPFLSESLRPKHWLRNRTRLQWQPSSFRRVTSAHVFRHDFFCPKTEDLTPTPVTRMLKMTLVTFSCTKGKGSIRTKKMLKTRVKLPTKMEVGTKVTGLSAVSASATPCDL